MNSKDFRRLALRLPGAIESAHMEHPDFRVAGKIFATLGYPDEQWGVVKLSPVEQAAFIRDESEAFVSVKGAWGRNGATRVHLASVDERTLRQAIVAAWRNTATKREALKLTARSRPKRKSE